MLPESVPSALPEGGKPNQEDDSDVWNGFYKKPLQTRLDQLKLLYPDLSMKGLPSDIADSMIENCIGTFNLPMGLALNFQVNSKNIVIPMCVEEASVIAALSGAAKTINQCGGFETSYTGNIMTSQVQLLDVPEPEVACQLIQQNERDLIECGNQFCATMKQRGGGLKSITTRVLNYNRRLYYEIHSEDNANEHEIFEKEKNASATDKMVVVHLDVDVCESMGANTVNTVAEGISSRLVDLVKGRVGMRIVTNLSMERRASAKFSIPLSKLGYKNKSGEEMAISLIECYIFAKEDIYRAVTHNKGIMNGVDAVAIALGQDFRAIEAAAHCYASRSGKYQPLTEYRLVKKNGEIFFEGFIDLPVPIGVRGGSIQSHPTMKFTHGLVNNPDCAQLGQILAAVGLAQNFAAIRAMASEGIQRGHMSLHARNIAIQAGVPAMLVPEVASYMVSQGKISAAAAKEYLNAHLIMTDGVVFSTKRATPPSTLVIEIDNVSLNVVFESLGSSPVHLAIKEGRQRHPLQAKLFGPDQTVDWFKQIFALLQQLRMANKAPKRNTLLWQNKVKLLSVMIHLVLFRLLVEEPGATHKLVDNILSASLAPLEFILEDGYTRDIFLSGAPLLVALWRTMKNEIDQIPVPSLANALKEEQMRVIATALKIVDVAKNYESISYENFLSIHSRRYQVTIFLLCELITVPPNLITPACLAFMYLLGSFLEMEGSIIHDLAHWEQSQYTKTTNAYLFWLHKKNLEHNGKTTENAFLEETTQLLNMKKEKLLLMRDSAPFFDLSVFLTSTQDVFKHYKDLMEMFKRAKL